MCGHYDKYWNQSVVCQPADRLAKVSALFLPLGIDAVLGLVLVCEILVSEGGGGRGEGGGGLNPASTNMALHYSISLERVVSNAAAGKPFINRQSVPSDIEYRTDR